MNKIEQKDINEALNIALHVINNTNKNDLNIGCQLILKEEPKKLRSIKMSETMPVLRFVKALAYLGYLTLLKKGQENVGSVNDLPSNGVSNGSVEKETSVKYEQSMILYEDATKTGNKWTTMFDDSRNSFMDSKFEDKVEEFLQYGKSYKVVVSVEEINV